MSNPHSRSPSVLPDEELRLPRPPGVIRRFWARHPRFTDVLIALLCLLMMIGSATSSPPDARPVPVPAAIVIGIVILGGCVLLMWRRRRPGLVMTGVIAVEMLVLAVTSSAGGVLFAVAVYSLAAHRSTRSAWIGLGAGVAIIGLMSAEMLAIGALTLQSAINTVLSEAIPGLIAALIGINIGNRRRYVEAIIDRSRQLLVERDQQAQLAAAAERDRIAREMHDIVSHSLTVVVALSEGAAATPDRERGRDASLAAAATARNALAEMRSMLGVLRDGDADAPLAPLEAADPSETVASAQRAGFPVRLAVRGEPDAAPALRLAIGRIVQEGVTNAIRHSPVATAIDVRIDHDADPVIIEIVNDGAGGTASEGGFGLRGLAERAALLGGVLVSAPAGEGRWMLRAELPHPPAAPTVAVGDATDVERLVGLADPATDAEPATDSAAVTDPGPGPAPEPGSEETAR